MDTMEEEVEEYSWREVVLPQLIPVAQAPVLEREPEGERPDLRRQWPQQQHAFEWALAHLCRLADTLHLVITVSSVHNEVVYEKNRELMEMLAVEDLQTVLVKSVARIVEGNPGKVICREADRLKPVAVVMGTRGRSIIQSVLQSSISEYCFLNCKSAPEDTGEASMI